MKVFIQNNIYENVLFKKKNAYEKCSLLLFIANAISVLYYNNSSNPQWNNRVDVPESH